MKRLNIGCGNNYEKGWINCDVSKKVKADYYFDCGKNDFPFENDTFSEIKAEMVFEHLPDYDARLHFLREIFRVGKKGCKIFLSVPHFSSQGAWGDLQHVRPFSFTSLDYFSLNKTTKYQIDHSQEIDGNSRMFFVKPKIILGKLHKMIGMESVANKFPLLYEMFLYGFFPARQLEFCLEAAK